MHFYLYTYLKKEKQKKNKNNIYIAYSRSNEICSLAVAPARIETMSFQRLSVEIRFQRLFHFDVLTLFYIFLASLANCTMCQPLNVLCWWHTHSQSQQQRRALF